MALPKVSIVLPNYNYARFLDARFRSTLNQTFTDFELIVVDDGSTDDSIHIIQRYSGDARVRMLLFPTNGGSVCRRWNDGAAVARGEYLLFALSDDSSEATMVETLVNRLDAHPSAGLAYCQSWIIDAEGRRLHNGKDWHDALDPDRWAADYVNRGADELRRFLFLTCTIPCPSAVLMRRKLFLDVGGLDEKLRLVADWKLWAQILARSDVALAAAPLCHFRTHPATVRQQAVRGLVFVEENYLIKSLIARLVDVPAETIEQGCESIANRWADYLADGRGQMGLSTAWERFLKIYRTAQYVDVHIGARLFPKLAFRLARNVRPRAVQLAKYAANRCSEGLTGLSLGEWRRGWRRRQQQPVTMD
jgi:hypothetical protein